MRSYLAAAGAVATLTLTGGALANPRALPFTYPYETLAKGEAEVEQYADMTIVKETNSATGATPSTALYLLQTEFEYGLLDHLELGLYVQVAPSVSQSFLDPATLDVGNAIKQRLRYRFAEAGEWPIDVSVYGEIVESEKLFEIEAKINLQRRFGNLRLMANLSGEHEFYYNGANDWEINPTLGATYQVLPWLHTGIESWLFAEFPAVRPAPSPLNFNLGPHVYVGPAVMFNWGKLWWSSGAYLRVTDVERPNNPGDLYGRLWVRTVVGLSL